MNSLCLGIKLYSQLLLIKADLKLIFLQLYKSGIQAYLGYCVTPSNYGLYPGYIADRVCQE
jgi:hypothetical protein